ncbi:MAG: 50S ribosomal protein L9 [Candidatus Wallbacteria bacterium]|nr:50S ribosomal protein L9 [Candidatus Wallbacteria bacterium]
MKVILLEDIKNLGKKGALLETRDGYAQNFLIPKKLAVMATDGNRKMLDHLKKEKTIKDSRELIEAREMAEKLAESKLVIAAKSGEKGKLYGSITSPDIAEQIRIQLKMEIDKRKIELEAPLKEIGKFKIKIKLYHDVHASLALEIKALEE